MAAASRPPPPPIASSSSRPPGTPALVTGGVHIRMPAGIADPPSMPSDTDSPVSRLPVLRRLAPELPRESPIPLAPIDPHIHLVPSKPLESLESLDPINISDDDLDDDDIGAFSDCSRSIHSECIDDIKVPPSSSLNPSASAPAQPSTIPTISTTSKSSSTIPTTSKSTPAPNNVAAAALSAATAAATRIALDKNRRQAPAIPIPTPRSSLATAVTHSSPAPSSPSLSPDLRQSTSLSALSGHADLTAVINHADTLAHTPLEQPSQKNLGLSAPFAGPAYAQSYSNDECSAELDDEVSLDLGTAKTSSAHESDVASEHPPPLSSMHAKADPINASPFARTTAAANRIDSNDTISVEMDVDDIPPPCSPASRSTVDRPLLQSMTTTSTAAASAVAAVAASAAAAAAAAASAVNATPRPDSRTRCCNHAFEIELLRTEIANLRKMCTAFAETESEVSSLRTNHNNLITYVAQTVDSVNEVTRTVEQFSSTLTHHSTLIGEHESILHPGFEIVITEKDEAWREARYGAITDAAKRNSDKKKLPASHSQSHGVIDLDSKVRDPDYRPDPKTTSTMSSGKISTLSKAIASTLLSTEESYLIQLLNARNPPVLLLTTIGILDKVERTQFCDFIIDKIRSDILSDINTQVDIPAPMLSITSAIAKWTKPYHNNHNRSSTTSSQFTSTEKEHLRAEITQMRILGQLDYVRDKLNDKIHSWIHHGCVQLRTPLWFIRAYACLIKRMRFFEIPEDPDLVCVKPLHGGGGGGGGDVSSGSVGVAVSSGTVGGAGSDPNGDVVMDCVDSSAFVQQSVPVTAAPGDQSVPATAAPGDQSVLATAALGDQSVPAAASPGEQSDPATTASGQESSMSTPASKPATMSAMARLPATAPPKLRKDLASASTDVASKDRILTESKRIQKRLDAVNLHKRRTVSAELLKSVMGMFSTMKPPMKISQYTVQSLLAYNYEVPVDVYIRDLTPAQYKSLTEELCLMSISATVIIGPNPKSNMPPIAANTLKHLKRIICPYYSLKESISATRKREFMRQEANMIKLAQKQGITIYVTHQTQRYIESWTNHRDILRLPVLAFIFVVSAIKNRFYSFITRRRTLLLRLGMFDSGFEPHHENDGESASVSDLVGDCDVQDEDGDGDDDVVDDDDGEVVVKCEHVKPVPMHLDSSHKESNVSHGDGVNPFISSASRHADTAGKQRHLNQDLDSVSHKEAVKGDSDATTRDHPIAMRTPLKRAVPITDDDDDSDDYHMSVDGQTNSSAGSISRRSGSRVNQVPRAVKSTSMSSSSGLSQRPTRRRRLTAPASQSQSMSITARSRRKNKASSTSALELPVANDTPIGTLTDTEKEQLIDIITTQTSVSDLVVMAIGVSPIGPAIDAFDAIRSWTRGFVADLSTMSATEAAEHAVQVNLVLSTGKSVSVQRKLAEYLPAWFSHEDACTWTALQLVEICGSIVARLRSFPLPSYASKDTGTADAGDAGDDDDNYNPNTPLKSAVAAASTKTVTRSTSAKVSAMYRPIMPAVPTAITDWIIHRRAHAAISQLGLPVHVTAIIHTLSTQQRKLIAGFIRHVSDTSVRFVMDVHVSGAVKSRQPLVEPALTSFKTIRKLVCGDGGGGLRDGTTVKLLSAVSDVVDGAGASNVVGADTTVAKEAATTAAVSDVKEAAGTAATETVAATTEVTATLVSEKPAAATETAAATTEKTVTAPDSTATATETIAPAAEKTGADTTATATPADNNADSSAVNSTREEDERVEAEQAVLARMGIVAYVAMKVSEHVRAWMVIATTPNLDKDDKGNKDGATEEFDNLDDLFSLNGNDSAKQTARCEELAKSLAIVGVRKHGKDRGDQPLPNVADWTVEKLVHVACALRVELVELLFNTFGVIQKPPPVAAANKQAGRPVRGRPGRKSKAVSKSSSAASSLASTPVPASSSAQASSSSASSQRRRRSGSVSVSSSSALVSEAGEGGPIIPSSIRVTRSRMRSSGDLGGLGAGQSASQPIASTSSTAAAGGSNGVSDKLSDAASRWIQGGQHNQAKMEHDGEEEEEEEEELLASGMSMSIDPPMLSSDDASHQVHELSGSSRIATRIDVTQMASPSLEDAAASAVAAAAAVAAASDVEEAALAAAIAIRGGSQPSGSGMGSRHNHENVADGATAHNDNSSSMSTAVADTAAINPSRDHVTGIDVNIGGGDDDHRGNSLMDMGLEDRDRALQWSSMHDPILHTVSSPLSSSSTGVADASRAAMAADMAASMHAVTTEIVSVASITVDHQGIHNDHRQRDVMFGSSTMMETGDMDMHHGVGNGHGDDTRIQKHDSQSRLLQHQYPFGDPHSSGMVSPDMILSGHSRDHIAHIPTTTSMSSLSSSPAPSRTAVATGGLIGDTIRAISTDASNSSDTVPETEKSAMEDMRDTMMDTDTYRDPTRIPTKTTSTTTTNASTTLSSLHQHDRHLDAFAHQEYHDQAGIVMSENDIKIDPDHLITSNTDETHALDRVDEDWSCFVHD